MAREVKCLYEPSREEVFEKSCEFMKPLVVRGVVKKWSAFSSWRVDSLRPRFAPLLIKATWSTDGVFRGDPETGFTNFEEMRFDRFIDLIKGKIKSERRYYLQACPFKGSLAELLEDIEIPDYIETERLKWTHLWLGPEGVVSALHFDYMDNLFCQVFGAKKLVLFAPEQADRLYPFPANSQVPFVSQVDIEMPDHHRFPRFKEAECVEAILQPGDMIFIPLRWWHQVYSLSMSASVNFWYPPAASRSAKP